MGPVGTRNNSAEKHTILAFPVFLLPFSWNADVIVGAPAAILDSEQTNMLRMLGQKGGGSLNLMIMWSHGAFSQPTLQATDTKHLSQ